MTKPYLEVLSAYCDMDDVSKSTREVSFHCSKCTTDIRSSLPKGKKGDRPKYTHKWEDRPTKSEIKKAFQPTSHLPGYTAANHRH